MMSRLPLLFCASLSIISGAAADELTIRFWYGDQQRFGHLQGHPQRWVNLLGSVTPAAHSRSLDYSINGDPPRRLSFREDRKRIARDGDFNIEIDRELLADGANEVMLRATNLDGEVFRHRVTVQHDRDAKRWPLPYSIDWSTVRDIQDVIAVVDGKWELTGDGIRSVEPYYDRVLAFGDATWRDYEVQTTVTVHALTPPGSTANNTGVTHAAIALRWPGHDEDGKQPSVKWYPLGATAEFRLGRDLTQCRWRIFDGKRPFYVESRKRRRIEFEKAYRMKHRVETLRDGRSHYRVKCWPADAKEPNEWDCERFESGDLGFGSALLIAHHSDVTFGNVRVVPLSDRSR